MNGTEYTDTLPLSMLTEMSSSEIVLPPMLSDYGASNASPHTVLNGGIHYGNDSVMPQLISEMEVVDCETKIESDDSSKHSNSLVDAPSNIFKHQNIVQTIQPKVRCLETFESLKDKCNELNIRFKDYNVYDTKSFEVDMIFDHKLIESEIFYLVKWKNYTTESNTWEPECHLTGCKETIEYYHAMRNSREVKVNKTFLKIFVRELTSRKPYDILSLTKTCALCFDSSEAYVESLQLTISQMKQKVKEILSFSRSRVKRISKKLTIIMQFAEARKHVLLNLKEWQDEINQLNRNAYIFVENNVDLEPAPSPFEFIHDYINTTVKIPEEPVAFCDCENCYESKYCCCPKDSEGHFAYSRFRRLILPVGYPIFECNKRCKCSDKCVNRVVQHGSQVRLCIFRTKNAARGWGLKTLDQIEKRQFVLEYLGEIITSDAAEARGHIYDYKGRSYLFDLDYGVDNNCCFTVDAGQVGNAAHFINHSCDPNLHVFALWINQPDPRLPRLAFFAKRRIKRGEELTFDYKMVKKDRFGPQNASPNGERILCKCNSKNCRKYLF